MKIAVNTRLLLKDQMEGIGWYTHELMKRVVKDHPEHEFIFLFDRPFDKDFIYADNVKGIVLNPVARHVFLISYWFDVSVKRALKKINPDVFFSPDSLNMLRPNCKTITSIHDVNFISNPKNFAFLLRRFYSKRTPITAQNTNKIITVSEYSKKEIVKWLAVNEEKVVSIYNACRPGFKPIPENECKEVRAKYTGGNPYFVFIGGLYKRKNLVKLVEAFEIFKSNVNSEVKLLIVGRKVKEADELLDRVRRSPVKDSIIMPGRIESDSEIHRIMASALALTYVSVLEGFGMPMVEAMHSEIPILASKTSSMPEIGGEAALYANPHDAKDIALKMRELYSDHELREKLVVKGKEQVKKFDWQKSANELWKVIEEVTNLK